MRNKIMKFINQFILEGTNEIKIYTELFNSNILDSFDLVQLVSYINEELGMDIEDYEIVENELFTVNDICDYLEK